MSGGRKYNFNIIGKQLLDLYRIVALHYESGFCEGNLVWSEKPQKMGIGNDILYLIYLIRAGVILRFMFFQFFFSFERMEQEKSFTFKLFVPPRMNNAQVSAVKPQKSTGDGEFIQVKIIVTA